MLCLHFYTSSTRPGTFVRKDVYKIVRVFDYTFLSEIRMRPVQVGLVVVGPREGGDGEVRRAGAGAGAQVQDRMAEERMRDRGWEGTQAKMCNRRASNCEIVRCLEALPEMPEPDLSRL